MYVLKCTSKLYTVLLKAMAVLCNFHLHSIVFFLTLYLSVHLRGDRVPIVQIVGPGVSKRLDKMTSKSSLPPISLYDNND